MDSREDGEVWKCGMAEIPDESVIHRGTPRKQWPVAAVLGLGWPPVLGGVSSSPPLGRAAGTEAAVRGSWGPGRIRSLWVICIRPVVFLTPPASDSNRTKS